MMERPPIEEYTDRMDGMCQHDGIMRHSVYLLTPEELVPMVRKTLAWIHHLEADRERLRGALREVEILTANKASLIERSHDEAKKAIGGVRQSVLAALGSSEGQSGAGDVCGDCSHGWGGNPVSSEYPCAACRRNPGAEILDYFLRGEPPKPEVESPERGTGKGGES